MTQPIYLLLKVEKKNLPSQRIEPSNIEVQSRNPRDPLTEDVMVFAKNTLLVTNSNY